MSWWRPKTPLAADETIALTENLAAIPVLYSQLPTIDEPDRPLQGEPNDAGGHTAPGSGVPINLTVIQLTDERVATLRWRRHDPGKTASIHRLGVLPMLVWWTDSIARQMQRRRVEVSELADPATVASECAWLTEVAQFALAQGWAPLFVRDIAACKARLDEAVTGKREPWVPRCLKCNNTLTEHVDEGKWYECVIVWEKVKEAIETEDAEWKIVKGCGKDYTHGALVDLGRRQPPMLGEDIAKVLGIAQSTITTWRHRKLITPARRDNQGRPLYYLADVMRVKERVRDRSEHRKGKPTK